MVIRHNITTKISDREKDSVHDAQASNVVSEKSSTFDVLYVFMVFSSHLNNTAPQEHNITLEHSNRMYFLCSVHTDLFLIHNSLLAFSDLSLPCCFFFALFSIINPELHHLWSTALTDTLIRQSPRLKWSINFKWLPYISLIALVLSHIFISEPTGGLIACAIIKAQFYSTEIKKHLLLVGTLQYRLRQFVLLILHPWKCSLLSKFFFLTLSEKSNSVGLTWKCKCKCLSNLCLSKECLYRTTDDVKD